MACAEAAAWGYLGFQFGEGWVRLVVGTLTSSTIAVLVWTISVSIFTTDRSLTEHGRLILGMELCSLKSRQLRDLFLFGLRVSILVVSLTIAAPYLTQLVFQRDIQQYIASQADEAIHAERRSISARYDTSISERTEAINDKHSEYERDVAGRGSSGRFGLGPVALAISQRLTSLEKERSSLVAEKQNALFQFDAIAHDWASNRERLASVYNLDLPPLSTLERWKALETLRERPEIRSTDLAIRTLFGFVFLSVLLLKLFEPSSVRLYLSEVLQQEFERYLAGTFDPALPISERSTTSQTGLSPQRLFEFLVRVWMPARRLEHAQVDLKALSSAACHNLAILESIRNKTQEELLMARADFENQRFTADEVNTTLIELQSAIAMVTADVNEFRRERSELEVLGSILDDKSRLEFRSLLDMKRSQAERALQELNAALPMETERFHRADVALKEVAERLGNKEVEFAELERRIKQVHEALLSSSDEEWRSAVGGAPQTR